MKKSLSMIFLLFMLIFTAFTTQTAFADEQSDIAEYTEQIKNNPKDYEAYNNRGLVYCDMKNTMKRLLILRKQSS